MEDNLDDYVFNIKTVQTCAIKILSESLKEILTDCNFIIDKNGIRLLAMDSTHTVLIHMKLDSENFEEFYCPKKVIVGLNMLNLFKLIKTMTNSDTLTLFMDKDNENQIGLRINNADKKTQTTYKLNLLDLDEDEIKIPPAEFDTELTMPSNDFQKIIRDMISIGENVQIQSFGTTLKLCCKGDFAQQETVLGETSEGLSFSQTQDPNKPTDGNFSLKYLILFTKCTNLCNLINIYIKNDYPLIMKYNVASLGSIKLCLAPNTE